MCCNVKTMQNAGREMKHELDITVADMKSGNYEAAITRLEARVGSAMMNDGVAVLSVFSVSHTEILSVAVP